MLSSHWTGESPLRRTISWNSLIDWPAWVWIGILRSAAAAIEARNSSSVQVSIWAGQARPERRPVSWASAASMTLKASSIALRPAASSSSYST